MSTASASSHRRTSSSTSTRTGRRRSRSSRASCPSVVVTHPLAPEDNLGLYRLLGGIFDRSAEAERLCDDFAAAYADLTAGPRPPARVLYLIWREPWMTVSRDTYISRTLALVGWETVPASAAERYPEVDPAAAAGSVDRVLLSSEPYRFREKHLAEVEALVPGARVTLIDGEMTSWYGSRAIEGLRYLGAYASELSRPQEERRTSSRAITSRWISFVPS